MTTAKEIIAKLYSANGNCKKLFEIFNSIDEEGFEAECVEYNLIFVLNLWEGEKLAWTTEISKYMLNG